MARVIKKKRVDLKEEVEFLGAAVHIPHHYGTRPLLGFPPLPAFSCEPTRKVTSIPQGKCQQFQRRSVIDSTGAV